MYKRQLCLCGSTRGYEILHSAQGRWQVRELLQAVFIRRVSAESFHRFIVCLLYTSGAADSTFVLQKNSRLANIASLHCTGRDIPDRTLKLEFGEEDHIWKLLEDSKTCITTSKISMLQIEILLSELLQKESEISAPAKALLEKIDPAGSKDWTPNSFSHQIRKNVDALRQNGILVSFRKSNGERLICLKRVDGADLPTVEIIVPIDPVGGQTACTAP